MLVEALPFECEGRTGARFEVVDEESLELESVEPESVFEVLAEFEVEVVSSVVEPVVAVSVEVPEVLGPTVEVLSLVPVVFCSAKAAVRETVAAVAAATMAPVASPMIFFADPLRMFPPCLSVRSKCMTGFLKHT